ncbi:hypothetical protein MMC13_007115 [Lambiella insularis]|nr:hypothetical protein [Lambiella insularis]
MSEKLSLSQNRTLEVTERVCSVLSLAGCSFIFATFLFSHRFRKPINRLVFYASWGNTLCNVGTLISLSGIRLRDSSVLCQLQGFLIQLCLPADAMWNLAMAVNVYLTVFKKYDAEQLRSMEWIYLLASYGAPLIPAFVYCFVSNTTNGKIYGDAVLWCWISPGWDYLRVATCYAPAWVCILITFTIYLLAGRDIFMRRRQLRSFNPSADPVHFQNPFTSEGSWKTTEVHITSELADMKCLSASHLSKEIDCNGRASSAQAFEQYTVTIGRGPERPKSQVPPPGPTIQVMTHPQNTAALEANTAAWGYTKCALLFFVSLLITWVPSSVFRVYSLVHPGGVVPWNLAYPAGLVLPLMGFWNSVIYIATSWDAIKSLPSGILPATWASRMGVTGLDRPMAFNFIDDTLHRRKSAVSLSDSMKGLADRNGTGARVGKIRCWIALFHFFVDVGSRRRTPI